MAYGTPQQTHRRTPPPRRGLPAWAWIVGAVVAVLVLAPFMVMAALDAKGDHLGSGSKTSGPAATQTTGTSWPPRAVPVTAKELGAAWPFTGMTRGFVACVAEHPGAIIFNPGDGPELGKPFALNGTALDAGYPDVPKRIWLPDPAVSGARKDITPLQDRAPNRCEKP